MTRHPGVDTGRTDSHAGGDGSTPPLAIEATDVHVTYSDGTEAVSGVDLAVPEGECFGFLGPNGAGKTTTVRTLVTLLRPTAGSVTINGYDAAENPRAVRESVGYMAQETSVDEELTARENLRFACRVYGVPASERAERVDALLDLVDLRDVADERAERFSGGMKKRLDAATALVHRPPVVFLDEPTTGLDPEARRRLWAHVEAINERGTTVFLTTQYLQEAEQLCDRLAVLEDGELVAAGTPERLKDGVAGETITLQLADATETDRERAKRAVRRVDTLTDATVEATADGLAVTAHGAGDAVADLCLALDEAGVAVGSVDVESPTLDDVFLAVTGEDDDRAEQSSATPGGDRSRGASAAVPQEGAR